MALSWLQRAYWILAGCVLAYVLGLAALTYPVVQRNATYLHNVNPTLWQNLLDVESFGFLRGQVTPFTVTTADNETIFAWHMLPAHVYKEHQDQLIQDAQLSPLPYEEIASQQGKKKTGIQLLLDDANAILIVTFHGNAGHLASAFRPGQYQNLLGLSTPSRPIHVISFDYRGFGLSTGWPSEEGVTLDAVTLLSHITGHTMPSSIVDMTNPALQSLQLSSPSSPHSLMDPSRIIIIGQSLGTFVSTSFYHAWTVQLRRPPFKGLILLASFSNLTKLLDSYSIKGITPPLFSPLALYPAARTWLHTQIVDNWDTGTRLSELVAAKDLPLDLTIMHALDDVEIPWREGWRNWEQCMESVGVHVAEDRAEFQIWENEEDAHGGTKKVVRWERLRKGGHNKIVTGEGVKVAVLRVLDGD
ncbi:hypothetical protein DV737_g5149, partial [Chaetothyriales sp. CBS 132003]